MQTSTPELISLAKHTAHHLRCAGEHELATQVWIITMKTILFEFRADRLQKKFSKLHARRVEQVRKFASLREEILIKTMQNQPE